MKIMYKNLTIIFLLVSFLISGTDGTLRGKITDSDGSALIGTQVYIAQLERGAIADLDGNFILLNIPIGEYEVKFLMIGYQTRIMDNVNVTMDQTTWLEITLPVATVEGEVVHVSSERALVEKGTTSKKVTINKEAIETLPIRNVSELYNLQSGVVTVDSKAKGIPDHSERGLEEVHVRGGRSGEIAYMIDGMYIRNPIYGGIGSNTRLNKFAIREMVWQPGGFNAEYGDAMSAVSNLHTMTGSNKFSYKFQYDTSLLGQALGSRYDELRDYHDYNFGFGGPFPFFNKLKFWVSGQFTNKGAETVLKFDDTVYKYGEEYYYFDELIEEWCFWGDCTEWHDTRSSYTWPWDNVSGYKSFGFDTINDYFYKLTYDITSQYKLTLSKWIVNAHTQLFHPDYIYWDEGRQELFRDTERTALEFNHTINARSFYTLRIAEFTQDHFTGVRWQDRDNDGYPDWYEYANGAGYSYASDPNNPDIVPFQFNNNGDRIEYSNRDGSGPSEFSSGWYLNAPIPGNYNWLVAEPFIDMNGNGLFDGPGSADIFEIDENSDGTFNQTEDDLNHNGQWDGPELITESFYRDNSYWLTPEMYVDHQNFFDAYGAYIEFEGLYPLMTTDQDYLDDYYNASESQNEDPRALYFKYWVEENIFGGTDKYYIESTAKTQELRFDYTNQMTKEWRTRFGFDYKSHKLDYFEIRSPWNDISAFRQRFSEQWDDYGVDRTEFIDSPCTQLDHGEGNGVWDGPGEYINPCTGLKEEFIGEEFDDFNGDGKWNSYVEPEELSMYIQNTFEKPWMVINAGVRIDAVQYNTKVWATDDGNYSPYNPYFYFDCGSDVSQTNVIDPETGQDVGEIMCPNDTYQYDTGYNSYYDVGEGGLVEWHGIVFIDDNYDYNENFNPQDEENGYTSAPGYSTSYNSGEWQILNENNENMTENGLRDPSEPTTSKIEKTNNYSSVIFKNSEWLYKISPRLGISHVIADGATFTFNYGLYYQTPIYEFIYRNISKLEDPSEAFEDAGEENQSIGNATMVAGRTQSYEMAFNVQFSRRWAFSAGLWVKDMDQLTTASVYNSGVYEYKVAKNGDFGTAIGFDFTVENRGRLFNTTIQYTYSTAKASSAYDAEAFGAIQVDAPQLETLMPYDRSHDLTLILYSTKLPWGLSGGITGFFQSGEPYTPYIFNGNKPEEDLKNEYSERGPSMVTMDMSLSKGFNLIKHQLTFGVNIFNVFDKPYPHRVFPLTGTPDRPGEYYEDDIGIALSGSYYDRPYYYSNNREVNFFIRIEFN